MVTTHQICCCYYYYYLIITMVVRVLLSLFLYTVGSNPGQSQFGQHLTSQLLQSPYLQNGYTLPRVILSRSDKLCKKGQTVNILSFAGHMVSVATTQLCLST